MEEVTRIGEGLVPYVDYNGMFEYIQKHDHMNHAHDDGCYGCVKCQFQDLFLDIKYGKRPKSDRCDYCPFASNSKASPKSRSSRVGVKIIFKHKFNVPGNYLNIGKHHVYFFNEHRQFSFMFPDIPQIDVRAKINIESELTKTTIKKLLKQRDFVTLIWVIHHINGNCWDDDPSNLALMLNTEHGILHKSRLNEREKADLIQSVIDRNRKMFNDPCWGNEE
jgi:hypothetical protein